MRPINISDKHNCSGCSACYSICPTNAIKMVQDEEGFLYPQIVKDKCVECGLCTKRCPYLSEVFPATDLEECYAAYNPREDEREISSSGGMFYAMAKKIIKEGGVVYGAAYDSQFKVYHTMVDNMSGLEKIVGSKYMQSRMEDCFTMIKQNVQEKKRVLFVGTSCQVAGLKSFLGNDYNNLICVDFICLGVPSPLVWEKYLEHKFNINEIEKINFKDKTNGWHNFSLRIKTKKRMFLQIGRQNIFFNGYFKGLYSRPSCSTCIYKGKNRVSDITISDCWGYSKIAPELDDNKGLSSIVIHSSKGNDFWHEIKDEFIHIEGEIDDVKKFNSNYCKPFTEDEDREAFWRMFNERSPQHAFRRYCRIRKDNIVKRNVRKISNRLKSILSK